MGKGLFVGVNNAARGVKKIWLGDASGRARKVKKVWLGDANNKARLVWQDFALPVYTGDFVLYGDEKQGRIELLSSGTLTMSEGMYDVFCVGGGGGGATASGAYGGGYAGGCGGASGRTATKLAILAAGSYAVIIGAGGVTDAVGGITKSDLGSSSAAGGNAVYDQFKGLPGSGGCSGAHGARVVTGADGGETLVEAGYSDGAPAPTHGFLTWGCGQGTTTRAFGEAINTLYSGGGGGAGCFRNSSPGAIGGSGGGGAGSSNAVGTAGTVNTGGGGGGGYRGEGYYSAGGSGGSGLVIVRWGY